MDVEEQLVTVRDGDVTALDGKVTVCNGRRRWVTERLFVTVKFQNHNFYSKQFSVYWCLDLFYILCIPGVI
jgi:hypothetical protein